MGNIVENVFNSFCILIQKAVCAFLAWVVTEFNMDQYKPNIDYFQNEVIGADNMLLVMTFFKYAGYVLLIMIFIFSFAMITFGNLIEVKDSIYQIILRAILCIALIAYGPTLMNSLLTVGSNVWDYTVEQFGDGAYGGENSLGKLEHFENGVSTWLENSIYDPAQNDDESEDLFIDDEKVKDYAGDDLYEALGASFVLIRMVARIVLFAIVAYNFLKLMVEIIKRYITMCILFMGMPTACAFLVSSSTLNNFSSYMKMFFVEIGVLIFTKIWVSLSLFLMGNIACGFSGMLILIAFITFGVRLEGFLKDIGLTISNTGGAFLDNCIATGAAMIMMARGVGHGVGGAMINIGAMSGNYGAVAVGSALTGKGLAPETLRKTAQDSSGGILRNKFSSDGINSPKKSNFTNSDYKNMDAMLTKGGKFGNDGFGVAYNSLNEAGKMECLDQLAAGKYSNMVDMLGKNGEGIAMKLDTYDPHKGFAASLLDKHGNVMRSGYISDTAQTSGQVIGFKDNNGKPKYLNLNPFDKNGINGNHIAVGDKLAVQPSSNGLSAAELLTGTPASKFGDEPKALEYIGTSDGGFDVIQNNGTDEGLLLGHQFENGDLAYTGSRWADNNVLDDIGTARSREDDFALQFCRRGENISIGSNIEINASADGHFVGTGYHDVSNVSFAENGKSVSFDYVEADGKSVKKAVFKQISDNSVTANGTRVNGGPQFGTWAAQTVPDKTKKGK